MEDQDASEGSHPGRRRAITETHARHAYVAASAAQQHAARRTVMLALAVLLILGGVATTLFTSSYFAAQRVAATFCAALVNRDYSPAYLMLDTQARDGLTLTGWASAAQALDSATGRVTACDASVLGGYVYQPGAETASDSVTLTRQRAAHSGAPIITNSSGVITLSQVGGDWRISEPPAALYGVSLASLAVAQNFCAALRHDDYAATFGLLDPQAQGTQTSADFATAQRLRDTLSGKVTACQIIGARMSGDQTLNALLSVTRTQGPREGGALQVVFNGSAWRITQIDAAILGADAGPYLVGQRFCTSITAGDISSAYALLTSDLQAQITFAQLRAALAAPSGDRWGCDQAASGSYIVTGATASYRLPLLGASGAPTQQGKTLQFALIEGDWQISGF
ncbi:MAG TPA: hypothetical protein VF792_06925 [Ktedonobacterales bacterium]